MAIVHRSRTGNTETAAQLVIGQVKDTDESAGSDGYGSPMTGGAS